MPFRWPGPGGSAGRRERDPTRRLPRRRSRCGGPEPPARGLPGARGPVRPRRAGRALAAGAGCGPLAGGRAAQLGESCSVTSYLEGPAAPRRAAFPGHVFGGPAQALEVPASYSRGGVGFLAALHAANKAGPRRKRLARGLPFTRVEINRGQRLPASLKMGFPERPNEKPSRDQLWGFRGDAATLPRPSGLGRENMNGEKRCLLFRQRPRRLVPGAAERKAGPCPLTCPRRPRPPRRGCRLFALGLSGAEIPFRFCE